MDCKNNTQHFVNYNRAFGLLVSCARGCLPYRKIVRVRKLRVEENSFLTSDWQIPREPRTMIAQSFVTECLKKIIAKCQSSTRRLVPTGSICMLLRRLCVVLKTVLKRGIKW